MDARASFTWIECTEYLYTKGGVYVMSGTLDECANEVLGAVINIKADYGDPD